MLNKRFVVSAMVLLAVLLTASAGIAAWEPSELIATPFTQQKAILTPSWTFDGTVYTYSYELHNTTYNVIDFFCLIMPSYINTAELFDHSNPGDFRYTLKLNNICDWTNFNVHGPGLGVGEKMIFSFKSYYIPDDVKDVKSNTEAGFLFGNMTYGPGPNIVPEPASCLALAAGLIGLVGMRRKRT